MKKANKRLYLVKLAWRNRSKTIELVHKRFLLCAILFLLIRFNTSYGTMFKLLYVRVPPQFFHFTDNI